MSYLSLTQMNKLDLKSSKLNLECINTIQIAIVAIISLAFRFIFPYSWRSLDMH